MAIAVGFISAMDGNQKTENYGYHETASSTNTERTLKTTNEVNGELTITLPVKQTRNKVNTPFKEDKTTSSVKVKGIDHSTFDALLTANVSSSGKVDYQAIKDKVIILDKYLDYLSQNVPKFSASKNEKLAFWINAYNASAIKLLVDNYPVESIMDLYGGKAFDNKWLSMGDEKLSLNDIENNKIRAKFNEPRIHFAVNCAAKSCPPILNRAWTEVNIQAYLEVRAKTFINNSAYNKLSVGSVQISKIFEWYAKDFPEDIVSYLNKYSNTQIDADAQVSYIEYDWTLNGK
jgi:hypothetical protein